MGWAEYPSHVMRKKGWGQEDISMPIRISLATLLIVLSAGALVAQEYTGFPETRMRQTRPDNQNVFMPEDSYTENRVVIRTTEIMPVGRGMQIRGDILTDFNADSVPATDDTTPRGQLSDINITVELFYYDLVLERDLTTNQAKTPKVDAKDEGRPVDGQSVTVKPSQSFAGFGLANFSLPVMSKPLAPGLYRLVARVRFKSQSNDLQKAFKWMSDWYGERSTYDEETFETIFEPVMGSATLHEEVYRDLMDRVGQVKTQNDIWIGEIWKDGVLDIIPADRGTDRKPANLAVWSHHALIVDQVFDYEDQLDNVDEVIDAELEKKLKVDGATEEMREKWRKDAEDDKARIRRDNKDLIDKYGGRLSKEELTMLSNVKTARTAVMNQILAFHEYLIYKYWIMVDGLFTYGGFRTINVPGYNAWEAVQKNDINLSTTRREDTFRATVEAAGGQDELWDNRREQWKFFAPEATQHAFKYFKNYEQSRDWDAKQFTKKNGNEVELDIEKWEKFREDFIVEFYPESERMLADVTTTTVYSTQIWPDVLASAKEARDDVIRSTYSWEHLIRMTEERAATETSEEIQEWWKSSPVQRLEGIELAPYYKKGTAQPGTLKTRFEANCNSVKSTIGLTTFTVAYRRAIEAEVDRNDLPGKRPPSAPNNE